MRARWALVPVVLLAAATGAAHPRYARFGEARSPVLFWGLDFDFDAWLENHPTPRAGLQRTQAAAIRHFQAGIFRYPGWRAPSLRRYPRFCESMAKRLGPLLADDPDIQADLDDLPDRLQSWADMEAIGLEPLANPGTGIPAPRQESAARAYAVGVYYADLARGEGDLLTRYRLLRLSIEAFFRHPARDWDPYIAANEVAAIQALRDILAAEDAMKASIAIDADGDGIGEYATLPELLGEAVRRVPAPGIPGEAILDTNGGPFPQGTLDSAYGQTLTLWGLDWSGYAFDVFLPDSESDPLFVTAQTADGNLGTLDGGDGAIGIDASEQRWVAYAQPLNYAFTGRRRFFINQDGLLLQSPDTSARQDGDTVIIRGASALTSDSFMAPPAVGTIGTDTDLWTEVGN